MGKRDAHVMNFSLGDSRNEIYARSDTHLRVFVSSKMADDALKAEREAAADAIEGFGLTKAWAWERSANAGPYCSEEECVRQAGTSDALILIIGGELSDITRKEYEAAYAAKVPIFAMLQAGADRPQEVRDFVALLRERGITTAFSTPGELASQVTKALHTWLLRSGRAEQLRRREAQGAASVARAMAKEVELGYGVEGPTRPIADLVKEAKVAVAAGKSECALEDLWEAAQGARDAGIGWLALELLDVLEEEVPSGQIDKRWQGWILNTRGLAFSDAERREEAEAAFSRMQQLGRELEDLDLQSTALQNLGICDVISERYEEAKGRFKGSIEQKMEIGDMRGALGVLTNMVNVLVPLGRLDDADALIDDAFNLLGRHPDPALRNTLHGHHGIVATARGDHDAARDHYRRALDAARRARSIPRQITTMQNLGSNAADRGKPKEAGRWYGKAMELAESIQNATQRRRQRQALALALMRSGQPDRAAELFELAAREAEELGDSRNATIAIGDAGACLLQHGDATGALDATERALRHPGDARDEWRAGQLRNRAAELAALDRLGEAAESALQAANLAENWEDEAAALSQTAQIAMEDEAARERLQEAIERELALRRKNQSDGEWAWRAAEFAAELRMTPYAALAVEYFSVALRSYAGRRAIRQVFFIRNDRALARADLGDLRGAAADLRASLDLAGELGDRVLGWQAHRNLGEIERRRERLGPARDHLEEARTIAADLDDPTALGEVQALFGLLSIDEGDLDCASEQFAAAASSAAAAQSQELNASALKGRAHVAFLRGRYGEATRLYRRAVRAVDSEPSRQLAESLNGVIGSEANRGKLAEEEITALDTLSRRIGWDQYWAESLRGCWFPMRRANGTPKDIATLAAVMLLVSFRGLPDEDEEEASDRGAFESEFRQALLSAMMVQSWIAAPPDNSRREAVVVAATEIGVENARKLVNEILGLVEGLPAIDDPLAEAEEESRASSL
jgi:tetratricopeptide (TPR) repeat protein